MSFSYKEEPNNSRSGGYYGHFTDSDSVFFEIYSGGVSGNYSTYAGVKIN
ncbi:MAG: hypothetical protein IPH78_01985 [Bacteroidetes bacterium]|nr:hypothetical protein [Bacteroidota bacterium]